MSDRVPGAEGMPRRQARGRGSRRLALALVLVLLAACQHGQTSFNRSTGTWSVPLGTGSSRGGQN
jgi:hypothetical protein